MIPTIEQIMKCYRIVAQTERMKTGRPCEETVANALRGASIVCRAAGIGLAEPITALTRKRIDAALASVMDKGLTRLTAWSYVCQLRAVFARWSAPYYADAGWEIPPLDIPAFRAQAPRYVRPSAEMLQRIKAWYRRQTGEHWFAATMMLEFAMRNGDVLRLNEENFVEKGGRRYLNYTPHKTELSSGRHVCWPIHDSIWRKLEDCGGLACLDVTAETFNEMNHDLRALGLHGHKASYELRKICIDHIYQKFGAEMASSISGDDIRTVMRYYADPSAVNVEGVRVVDLL